MIGLVGRFARIWFNANWMYAGAVASLFLLAVLPLFADGWSIAMVAVYLQLPAYMLHQVEEHAGDRFRRFVNRRLAGGANALTVPAVLFINIALVWGVDLASIYLARFVAIGWGLVAVYLALVNSILHIAGAAVLRGYNPGLVTAVVLFVPLGIWGLVAVAAEPAVTTAQHGAALALAILVHAAIAAHVARRARALKRARGAAI